MDSFKLKSNEVLFFLDFNNTLVDYAEEYDSYASFDELRYANSPQQARLRLEKSLIFFEEKTGLTPVICVITNAKSNVLDNNGYPGIFNDMVMTFFRNRYFCKSKEFQQNDKLFKNSCERYFKFLVYKDNDHYYKIDAFAPTDEEVFERIDFDDDAMSIRLCPEFKKRESVERILSQIDPTRTTSKYIIFAGDEIKDDYPMKEIETPYGVSKIFIRPGRSKKITPEIMKQFCEAKGDEFTCISKKTGKKIKNLDQFNFSQLSEYEQNLLNNFSSGDTIFLTDKNNLGLVQGIYQSADLIAEQMGMNGGIFGE